MRVQDIEMQVGYHSTLLQATHHLVEVEKLKERQGGWNSLVPFLNLIWHLKMDGWNTIKFPFGIAYFQGQAVSHFQGGYLFLMVLQIPSTSEIWEPHRFMP